MCRSRGVEKLAEETRRKIALDLSPRLAGSLPCANLYRMNAVLSPIVSEFETQEQEASYDLWFRAKVEEAMHSEKPRLPHDAAMAKVQAQLDERRKARANRSVV